jgi:hypothetical protein
LQEEEEKKVEYDPYDMLVRQMTYERKEARGSGEPSHRLRVSVLPAESIAEVYLPLDLLVSFW